MRDYPLILSWLFWASAALPSINAAERKNNTLWKFLISLVRNDDWKAYYSTAEHLSIDGATLISGHIMRRRSADGMIYREMTEDENRDRAWDQANQL